MILSRRQVTQVLAGLVVTAAPGTSLTAAIRPPAVEDLTLRLQRDLEAHVGPGCPITRLDVIRLDLLQTASGRQETFRLDAVVRLTWPPGVRQCPFLFYGPDPESAYSGLRDQVIEGFARVHPDCIA